MSFVDKFKRNKTEASEELISDVSDSSQEQTEIENTQTNETLNEDSLTDTEDLAGPGVVYFEPTIHFEIADILNAIEHIDTEQDAQEEPTEPELPEESDISEDPVEPEIPEEPIMPEIPAEAEAPEEPAVPADTAEPAELTENKVHEKAHENKLSKPKHQDAGTKKLALTDIILFVVIVASIVMGLVAANAVVDKANAANEQKIAEKQANIKQVDLTDSLYDMAADQVIEDVAVPTYSLDELYALDLREPTGFTANDLKKITRKGLVGCEEAFVEAEKTYGVNCIFLLSIASLESAHGTQMFRPNNMFGYGRTGFSSKQEGIMTVAKGLGTRYLNPSGGLYGGSPTLKGVNKRYASNPQWYYKVGKYMQGYYAELASEKNGALDKFK